MIATLARTVRRVDTHYTRRELPTGVFVVTDGDDDAVVRLTPARAGRWRCSACQIRSASTDCLHIFAVAIHLAETELGLTLREDIT